MPERERERERERKRHRGRERGKVLHKSSSQLFQPLCLARRISILPLQRCSSRLEEPPSGRRSRAAGAGESRDREPIRPIARMKAASLPICDRGGGPTFRPGQRDVIRTDTQVGWRTALSPAVGGFRGVRPLTANREANDGSRDRWLTRGGETYGRGKQEMPSCPG